jgi:CubicO group peptidase (beta-lactamase class C family)
MKRTASTVLAVAAVVFACSWSTTATAPNPENRRTTDYSKLIQDFRQFVPQKLAETKVAGTAVAVVDGDRLVWSEGFGYVDAAHSQKVAADTVFSLQSISKTYTAVLFLQAVDRGWFKLDDPLIKYIPEFTARSRFGDDEFRKITLRQLLSHWSSLPHEAPVGNNYDDGKSSFQDHIQSINQVWLLAPVGSRYAYSNLGFDLLAYLLQLRSGKPFSEYADEHLFRKLGMSHSTFDRSRALSSPSFARGQDSGRDVEVFPPMLGAGGLYSTANDMASFVSAQLRETDSNQTRSNQRRLLNRQTLAEMRTPQFTVDHQSAGYGFGLFKRRAFGTTMYSHGGGGYGYDTEQRWFPDVGLGVVVLTNDGDGNDMAQTIADYISEACIRAKAGSVSDPDHVSLSDKPVQPASPAELAKFEGSYRAYSGMRFFNVVDGVLRYKVGNNNHPLQFHGNGEFTTADERFRFHLDSSGNAAWADDLGTVGVDTFVLNDRPGETPGPDKPEWKPLLGTYFGFVYGEKVPLKIYEQNGYLYASRAGGSRLIEYRPGLFFTVWGESVEFHGDVVLYGNRRFVR